MKTVHAFLLAVLMATSVASTLIAGYWEVGRNGNPGVIGRRGVCFGVCEKRFLAKICFKHLRQLKLLKGESGKHSIPRLRSLLSVKRAPSGGLGRRVMACACPNPVVEMCPEGIAARRSGSASDFPRSEPARFPR